MSLPINRIFSDHSFVNIFHHFLKCESHICRSAQFTIIAHFRQCWNAFRFHLRVRFFSRNRASTLNPFQYTNNFKFPNNYKPNNNYAKRVERREREREKSEISPLKIVYIFFALRISKKMNFKTMFHATMYGQEKANDEQKKRMQNCFLCLSLSFSCHEFYSISYDMS